MAYSPRISVVIVTYNSQSVIFNCINALMDQSLRANRIIILDNCSSDPTYLDSLSEYDSVEVFRSSKNFGFCAANNIGFRNCRDSDYILFLNPDAFLEKNFLSGAIEWIEMPENENVGILTGLLLGFDILNGIGTGNVDSSGIFQSWYGRWYDRYQGRALPEVVANFVCEEVPAACGALMLCRSKALISCLVRDDEVFDEKFFMYKEDIDLSIRVRRTGWKIVFEPKLKCWHCRGWTARKAMPYWTKMHSVQNEVRVSVRNRGRGILYSLIKLVYVSSVEPCVEFISVYFKNVISR